MNLMLKFLHSFPLSSYREHTHDRYKEQEDHDAHGDSKVGGDSAKDVAPQHERDEPGFVRPDEEGDNREYRAEYSPIEHYIR